MSYTELGFDESNVVSEKFIVSEFEDTVMSDIMIDAYETNFHLVFEKNTDPVRFKSKQELIENYWSTRLN
jgi:hypothetical protein